MSAGFVTTLALVTPSPGQEAAAQGQGLKDIVENVRANEELYRNIEVRVRRTYRLGEPTDPQPNYIASGDGSARYVFQNGMIYFKNDEEIRGLSGEVQHPDTLQGFDGKTTRIVEQNAVANIRLGRVEDSRLLRPHCLFLGLNESAGVNFPLSTYLMGGKEVKSQPAFRDATITVRYLGDEVKDGLDCHKLQVDYRLDSWKDDQGADVRYIWLSPERNYFPVRTEFYSRPKREGDSPLEIGRAEDFREISPGVWFPFRATVVGYDPTAYRSSGKLVVKNTTELVVDQAELDPHYDIKLFQDIPIPDGAQVLVIENDKVVKKYTKGGRHTLSPQAGGWLWPATGLASAVLFPTAFILMRRRSQAG